MCDKIVMLGDHKGRPYVSKKINMELTIEAIKIGDVVKVKKGIKAPDFSYQLMDDWQGKVIAIHVKEELVEIEWDAETILRKPDKYLADIIKEGYDYEMMTLEVSDLERANKRDAAAQEEDMEGKVVAKLYWIELFEEDEAKAQEYSQFFKGIDMRKEYEILQKWYDYLSEHLDFPFTTKVVETERGGLKIGTKIKLLDLEDYDDRYGILAIGKEGRGAITTLLCNLEAIDQKSKNYDLLRDYVVWFANR
jgi:hypothetical protein